MRADTGSWVAGRVDGVGSQPAAAIARLAAAVGRVVERLGRRRIRIPPMSEEWLRRHDVEDAKHGEGW